MNDDDLVANLQQHYGSAARRVARGGVAVTGAGTGATDCCGPASDCEGDHFGAGRYDPAELAGLPSEVAAGSIGCANPVALVDLQPGQDVLDLGSGGGIDVLLSARRVGPTGRAYGLDMNADMLALARDNQRRAGLANAEFLEGRIEQVPLPDRSVDVVMSNCVINLSADKDAVFAEALRVLRPGGRLAVADVVADREPDPALRADPAAWATCTAGAITRDDYRRRLAAAGFVDVDIADSHEVGDGFWSVLVRARRP
ncbi:MAG TPA: arsenite methyltransferase [Acidimicrobiales bacterium]|nr:arsenite methyltransferase [Acidimicrobiales bacterium]